MAPRIRRRITTAKREEIENQQKALSQAIVRPFEVLSGLPVSYNPPPNGHYEDVLKNPLTIKDTGVLYRSLMKSRLNYMNMGPMFKLYWLKQSSYAKKMQQLDQEKNTYKSHKDDKSSERVPILGNDVSARDVMVKLCDASLSLGPHKFEIRLFIAKDERSEKNGKKKDDDDKVKKELNDKDELNGKEGANNTNKKTNAINENENIKATSVNTELKSTEKLNIHTKEAQVNEDSSKEENTNMSKDNIRENTQSAQPITNEPGEGLSDTSDSNHGQKTNSTNNPIKDQDQLKPKPSPTDKSETGTSKDSVSKSDKKQATSKIDSDESDKMASQNQDDLKNQTVNRSSSRSPKDTATTSNTQNTTSSSSQTATLVQPPSTGDSSVMNQSSVSTPQNPTLTPPTVPKTDPNSMQSIENTIMIANLNTIARVDQSLNALMKIVALGNASPQQIITFQGYIQRAREMGPQPHHAYLFPNGILPNQRPRKLQKDKKPPKEKKPPKPKVPKDQKLTAFQEKYITDATLLFEFVENANVRYMLPQEAICEVLPPATFDAEEPDNKDILVSFLWIHNQKEVDNYNQKLNEYNEFKKKEEEELSKDKLQKEDDLKDQNEVDENKETQKKGNEQGENEQKPEQAQENDQNNPGEQKNKEDEAKEVDVVDQKNEEELIAKPSRRPPPRKGRRRRGGSAPNKKAVPKKIECPVEPEIKYTALSFTIHGIPLRYVPIIVNSFKKLEDVQERMSYILKNGTRTTSFYLWYQVDGKLDESIAEEVRVQLNQEEKKMQGVTSIQSATSNSTVKKRKQKEKGTEPKPKKNKSDTKVSTTAPVLASAPLSVSAPVLDSTQISTPASTTTLAQRENQSGN